MPLGTIFHMECKANFCRKKMFDHNPTQTFSVMIHFLRIARSQSYNELISDNCNEKLRPPLPSISMIEKCFARFFWGGGEGMGGRDLISFFVLFKIAAFTCAVHLIRLFTKTHKAWGTCGNSRHDKDFERRLFVDVKSVALRSIFHSRLGEREGKISGWAPVRIVGCVVGEALPLKGVPLVCTSWYVKE